MQMPPTQLVSDTANLGLADAVLFGDDLLRPIVVKDSHSLLGCKFGVRALLSAIGSAVLYAVSLVGAWRVPAKVREAIVRQVSIVVATLKSWRGRPAKGQQDEPANAAHFVDTVFPKKKEMTSVLLVYGKFFDASCFGGSYTTSIRYFIDALKPYNVFPLFHTSPISSDIGIVASVSGDQ